MKVPVILVLLLAATGVQAQPDEPAGAFPDPDCEEDPTQTGCAEACVTPERVCAHPPCPTDLAGYAPQSGGVFMSWTVNSYSDIRVYRDTGRGFDEIAYLEFPATRFIDQDTQPGATYRYQVTAVGMHQYNQTTPAEGESPACSTLEVTTVPFGSAPVLTALSLASVAGYAAWQRFASR